ncbi:hypothetical protein FNV43_RR03539 [Rhamnella rubrinervis]|uniref:Uncharacterized protein n=1 Tax=Rhamnella rubrinervis TaxID=2594499 RepID=A0A8K0HK06_9ROSA|nr:hypothetical protein FNV43_RR03539 [Rhamnella rubrinervis]
MGSEGYSTTYPIQIRHVVLRIHMFVNPRHLWESSVRRECSALLISIYRAWVKNFNPFAKSTNAGLGKISCRVGNLGILDSFRSCRAEDTCIEVRLEYENCRTFAPLARYRTSGGWVLDDSKRVPHGGASGKGKDDYKALLESRGPSFLLRWIQVGAILVALAENPQRPPLYEVRRGAVEVPFTLLMRLSGSGGGCGFATINTHGAFFTGCGTRVYVKVNFDRCFLLDSCLEVWDSVSCCTLAAFDHHFFVKHLLEVGAGDGGDIHDKITLALEKLLSVEHYCTEGFRRRLARDAVLSGLNDEARSSKKLSWDRLMGRMVEGRCRDSSSFIKLRIRKSGATLSCFRFGDKYLDETTIESYIVDYYRSLF